MTEDEKSSTTESVPMSSVAEALRQTRPFTGADPHSLQHLGPVERLTVPAGEIVIHPGEPTWHYWIVLSGEIRAERLEADGSPTIVGQARTGEGFGEVPLLTGKSTIPFRIVAIEDCDLVRLPAEQFWALLACCPEARAVILADAAQRLHTYQVEALHREKLVSLGTLAAGLMHELHNPGAAAKRSASQLRENLMKLQQLSLRSSNHPKTPEQWECMKGLLEHTLHGCRLAAMSSIEQADAEESLGAWLSASGVENAYTIAPALVSMGFDQQELACAKEYFEADAFSDALNWLGALVSSVSLVCAIEESISRISDLVMAVKKFAYDERSPARDLDVHDSLQSTLTILGHKLRLKQIQVEKRFEASPSVIHTRGSALSQVWTNLIDNAADASQAGGQIEISTWTETDSVPGRLVICIQDHGSGIPADALPHIFEAFFTTKPQGSGTGLGLEIVHRIVTQKFGGAIEVQSQPGDTRFLVRLPLADSGPKPQA
ncbi:MAG TPA: ATP-binding protein [Terracidiphilus sp.]|nr:ATP-binding protein [Terracidiphilus sp.]